RRPAVIASGVNASSATRTSMKELPHSATSTNNRPHSAGPCRSKRCDETVAWEVANASSAGPGRIRRARRTPALLHAVAGTGLAPLALALDLGPLLLLAADLFQHELQPLAHRARLPSRNSGVNTRPATKPPRC